MLAFYALARILLKSKAAALFTSCIFALSFLINLQPSQFTFGESSSVAQRRTRSLPSSSFYPGPMPRPSLPGEPEAQILLVFAFVCWASVVVHPVGLTIIGLSMAGFGLVHVVLNPLSNVAWAGMVQLGAALLSFGVVPALFVLTTGKSFTALLIDADKIGTTYAASDPVVLANMVFVVAKRNRILDLGDGSYMMDPYLLHDPIILGALLLGLPFLLLRLKHSLAAQLLAGMLLLVTVVCYEPSVAMFFGNNIVVPDQLWRLAWPLPPC
jgi:hypothetical protein